MNRFTTLALAAALAVPAFASAPDAWAEHEAAVIAACTAASGLNNVQVASELIQYDDSLGIDALLITGEYPQAHMAGQPSGLSLCVFNKATGAAAVSEITPK